MVAEYLIDRAAFGEHPLGRTVLGPEENLRSFTREGIVAFRERRWAGARGGAFLVGNLDHLPDEPGAARSASGASRARGARPATSRRRRSRRETLVEERDTNQSHLRMIYRPTIAVADVRERAGADDLLDAARRLDGLAPVRRDPREARALLLGLRDRPRVRRRADPAARLGPGVEQVRRGVHAHARDRRRAARATARPRRRSQRARAYAAGAPRARVREHQRRRPLRRQPDRSSSARSIDPDAAIAALDAVTFEEVREVAAGVADNLAVACVGPHAAEEF